MSRVGERLAAHAVEVVASLPCYLEENVNAQRGEVSGEISVTHTIFDFAGMNRGIRETSRPGCYVISELRSSGPPSQSAVLPKVSRRWPTAWAIER